MGRIPESSLAAAICDGGVAGLGAALRPAQGSQIARDAAPRPRQAPLATWRRAGELRQAAVGCCNALQHRRSGGLWRQCCAKHCLQHQPSQGQLSSSPEVSRMFQAGCNPEVQGIFPRVQRCLRWAHNWLDLIPQIWRYASAAGTTCLCPCSKTSNTHTLRTSITL